MKRLICKPCRAELAVPTPLSDAIKRRAATRWRAGDCAGALAQISEQNAGDVDAARALLLHVPRWRGYCHQCRESIHAETEIACPHCGAVNLGWVGEDDPPGPPFEGPGPVSDHPLELENCPSCDIPLGHGSTRCWEKGCGFALPEGFVAVVTTG